MTVIWFWEVACRLRGQHRWIAIQSGEYICGRCGDLKPADAITGAANDA